MMRSVILVAAALACAAGTAFGDRLDELQRPWERPAERLNLTSYIGALDGFVRRNPGRAALEIRGRSPKGLPVYLLKLTDASVPDVDKNVILVTTFHSGAERTGTAGAMAFADWLLGDSEEAKESLRRNLVLVMPIVNPEGYFLYEHWGNSRLMDIYALGRGNRVDLETQELKNPEDGPEVLAYRSVADEFKPDVHVDVHGTGLHFNGQIQPSTIGRAGSNSSLRCWDDRLVRLMMDASSREGWGYLQFDADSQRLVWDATMGNAQRAFCEMGVPYYSSQHYGYFRQHTLPIVIEATWADQALAPLKGLMTAANKGLTAGPVEGFSVNRIRTGFGFSLDAYGTTRSARRDSRVALWSRQQDFALGSSYPETANWRIGVVAYGEEGHRVLGTKIGTDGDRWGSVQLTDFLSNLKDVNPVDLAGLGCFVASAPPEVKRVSFKKGVARANGKIPTLDSGLALTLQLPTTKNDILHLALNGRELKKSPTDGYQSWVEGGFTVVRVNVPKERAAAGSIWIVTCAWNPIDLPARFGWVPDAETVKAVGGEPFKSSAAGKELAKAKDIESYWRKNRATYFDKEAKSVAGVAKIPPLESFKGHRNVAASACGSFAEICHADGTKTKAASVISGSHDDAAVVTLKGVPATLTVEFPAPADVNAVRIYPGSLQNAGNASGECGVRDYLIEYFNNGYWHKAAEGKGQPSFAESGTLGNESYALTHTFKSVTASAMRLTVTASGDTGRRNGGTVVLPQARRISMIRAFEVFESAVSDNQVSALSQLLTGDFPLPVYRAQKVARLSFELEPGAKGFSARAEVREEKSAKVVQSQKVLFAFGKTTLSIPLEGLPDGRYVFAIVPEDGAIKGELRRMLRIDRGGTTPLPVGTIDVRGLRVFPVDDFHFAKRVSVTNEVIPAEAVEVTKPFGSFRCVQDARSSTWLDRDESGNYVMMYRDAAWNRQDWKTHYAVSRDLVNWTMMDETPSGKPNRRVVSPWDPLPPAAQPRWQQKTAFKDAKIRFYEPSDGQVPLNEVRVAWLPPSAGDVAGKGLVPWGNYPVWEKNKGEWIVLLREPIIVCKFNFEPEELESDIDSNDNFGSQFLSDDGRTLFFSQASKLRRFPPYVTPYDNLPQASRIMRTYYSSDGFHWQSRFLCLPEEMDHTSFQHYGIANFRVTRNFYLGYLHAYPANRQQIYPEVVYSRDGLNWNRIPGSKPFVANTPFGTWLSGMIFVEPSPVPYEKDGEYLVPLGANHRNFHFYLYNLKTTPERLTADYVRRCFGERGLETGWPLFAEAGGWEGLAKDMREYSGTVGIARFRKDGWIAVKPTDGKVGKLISRVFSAPGSRLLLNAKGEVAVLVCDASGKELPGYSGDKVARFKGNETAKTLSWGGCVTLPQEDFVLKIALKFGSELYTLRFE